MPGVTSGERCHDASVRVLRAVDDGVGCGAIRLDHRCADDGRAFCRRGVLLDAENPAARWRIVRRRRSARRTGACGRVTQSLARALWGDRDPVGRSRLDEAVRHHDRARDRRRGRRASGRSAHADAPGALSVDESLSQLRAGSHCSRERRWRGADRVDARGVGVDGCARAALPGDDARESVGVALAQDRFTTCLLAGFALLAIVLAAVGVYGVLAATSAPPARRSAFGSRSERERQLYSAWFLAGPFPRR